MDGILGKVSLAMLGEVVNHQKVCLFYVLFDLTISPIIWHYSKILGTPGKNWPVWVPRQSA